MSELDDIFDVGDLVVWEFKHQGIMFRRIGEVVLWVNPRRQLRRVIPEKFFEIYNFNGVKKRAQLRDQESYLVATAHTTLPKYTVFWPFTSSLIKIGPLTISARLDDGEKEVTVSSLADLREAILKMVGKKKYTEAAKRIADVAFGVVAGVPVNDLVFDVEIDFFARPKLTSDQFVESKVSSLRIPDNIVSIPVFPTSLSGKYTSTGIVYRIVGVD